MEIYRGGGKRLLDLIVAAPLLLLFAPLLLLVALGVRVSLGSPVLFRQDRLGFRGRGFTLVKFRSLSDLRGPDGRLLADVKRQTRWGKLLRRTSLDELPELWNVVRGEMSLVGPRPLLPQYWDRYSLRQRRRHEARPGITGWAQVNGRNHTTWSERFEFDLWYIDHISLSTDIKILVRTLGAVLTGDGGVEQGARLGEFQGNSLPDSTDFSPEKR